jgi:branched-chain amino acid transport system substrate-binding protein
MKSNKEAVVLIATLFLTTGLAGGGIYYFLKSSGKPIDTILSSSNALKTDLNAPTDLIDIASRISNGEKMLISADATADKEAGIKAYAAYNYEAALERFESSLSQNPNDPETLIYRNNAKIGRDESLGIAIVVPTGSNLNVAKEILRGAAQAQTEINQMGGIKSLPLKLTIANDDNKPPISKPIAEELVKDLKILAVLGHNNSEATLAGAQVYQDAKLVMISATATAKGLSGFGSYIFRTSLNVRFQADSLSRYAVKDKAKKNIGICISSESKGAVSMMEEFTSAVFVDGGKISQVECNMSANSFDPAKVVSEMVSDGVDGLLLYPSVDTPEKAIAIAKEAKGKFLLLSDSTLYTYKVLEMGQSEVSGMVLTVPWHPQAFPGNPFPGNAVKLWGGNVNWRSATSYDAMQVIIGGLRRNSLNSFSRIGLQQEISNPKFNALGATGKIQFQRSGDRNNSAILVTIMPGKSSGTGYDFKLLSK